MQPYVATLYLGIVVGVVSGTVWAGVHGLDAARVNAAMLLLIVPALVGARLLYVGLHWPLYRHNPRRIMRRSEGGAALYGGLAAALVVSFPLLAVSRVPVAAFWDAASICLLVGMIFTKVGCLMNGCCAGRSRFPVQLMEAGLAGLLLLASIAASDRLPFDGALFLSTLTAYGVGRFALEPWRKTIDKVGCISINRAVSAGVAVLSATSFLLVWLT